MFVPLNSASFRALSFFKEEEFVLRRVYAEN
jgi:hypothetical protein